LGQILRLSQFLPDLKDHEDERRFASVDAW